MKVIVSYDIDHLYWSEHIFRDLYIPKYLVKALLNGMKGNIPAKAVWKRMAALADNRMHRLNELNELNRRHNIPATYFIGMSNALSLSYTADAALQTVRWLNSEGFDTGVHGIAYDEKAKMEAEYALFSKTTSKPFGIRNHYLRMSDNTLAYQSEIGYSFGSTTYALRPPFKQGSMWEFPVSLMDVYCVKNPQNNYNLELWKTNTINIIGEAIKLKLPYFVLNFHDPYYADAYAHMREWYDFIIDHFATNGFEFTSFKKAVEELNTKDYKVEQLNA